jgi:hypothetical protein
MRSLMPYSRKVKKLAPKNDNNQDNGGQA